MDIGNCENILPWDYIPYSPKRHGNQILVMNSNLRVRRMPACPFLNSIIITGDVRFSEAPTLTITEHLQELNLASLRLSKLSLELENPKRLFSIYLMDNQLNDLLVSRPEDSRFFPSDFKMVVDKKDLALKLRNLLNRKAIGFLREK